MTIDNHSHWFYLFTLALLALSCAYVLVVYLASNRDEDIEGGSGFTLYMLTSMLVWLLYAVFHNNSIASLADIPGNALIIACFLLFISASGRAGVQRGRWFLALISAAAILAGLFLDIEVTLWVHNLTCCLCLLAASACLVMRSRTQRNGGDALMAIAALIPVFALPVIYYARGGSLSGGQPWLYGIHGLTYLMQISGFLASLLEDSQRRLLHSNLKDPVTRVLNRQGLAESMSVSMASASRKNASTTALAIDVDHFRQINNAFGDAAGNRVLQHIANQIRDLSRSSDALARDDQDCFIIVLPDTRLEEGRNLAERIRQSIADQNIVIDGQAISITVSVGASSYNGFVELDDMCDNARQACQLAKQNGRNCVAALDNRVTRISGAVT
ncbi:MAG: hypothetical protein CSA53_05755 [Gammaproteobacteria bacterium]|nr:MAG: hypothetical protein CSA53_05755 [Gammaproteobacteria bacterium]